MHSIFSSKNIDRSFKTKATAKANPQALWHHKPDARKYTGLEIKGECPNIQYLQTGQSSARIISNISPLLVCLYWLGTGPYPLPFPDSHPAGLCTYNYFFDLQPQHLIPLIGPGTSALSVSRERSHVMWS